MDEYKIHLFTAVADKIGAQPFSTEKECFNISCYFTWLYYYHDRDKYTQKTLLKLKENLKHNLKKSSDTTHVL